MAESNSAVLPLHHTPKRRLPVHLDLVTLSYPRMRLLCIHDTKLQVPSKLFRFSKRNGVKGGIEPSRRCSQHRRLPLPHYHHSNRVTPNDWVFTSSFWSGSIHLSLMTQLLLGTTLFSTPPPSWNRLPTSLGVTRLITTILKYTRSAPSPSVAISTRLVELYASQPRVYFNIVAPPGGIEPNLFQIESLAT